MPLLTIVFSLLIGWPIARYVTPDERERTAWAVFLGLSVIMLSLTNAGYFGFSIKQAGLPILAVLLFLALMSSSLIVRRERSRSQFSVSAKAWPFPVFYCLIPFVLAYFVHILPVIIRAGQPAAIALDAGDLPTYTALGDWLVNHPISQKVIIDSAWNPVLAEVKLYQDWMFRIGVLHLFALPVSLTGVSSLELFTVFSGIAVGIQSLAVWVLLYHLSKKSIAFSTFAAVVFALHPLLHWSAYAAFLPQTLGLAIMIMWVVFLEFGEMKKHFDLKFLLIFGLLTTAQLSAYNELLPINLVIACGILLRKFIKKALSLTQITLVFAAMLLLPIVFYPVGTIQGIQGLIHQILGSPCGGMQVYSGLALTGTLFGVVVPPIIPENWAALTAKPMLLPLIGLGCAAGLIFVLSNTLNRLARGLLAIFGGVFAALLIYIALRYNQELVRNWNSFKAVQYGAPVFFPLLLLGIRELAGKSKRSALLLALLFFLPFGIAQAQFFQRVQQNALVLKPIKELYCWAQAHPQNRIYLADIQDSVDRYLVLTSLRDIPVIAAGDPIGRKMDLGGIGDNYYRQAFSHIAAPKQSAGKYAGAPVVETDKYVIFDVSKKDIIVPFVRPENKTGSSEFLAKVSHSGEYDLAVEAASPLPQKVTYTINGESVSTEIKHSHGQINITKVKLKPGLNRISFSSSGRLEIVKTGIDNEQ